MGATDAPAPQPDEGQEDQDVLAEGQEDAEVMTTLPPALDAFLQALADKGVEDGYLTAEQKEGFIKSISSYYFSNEGYPSTTFRALVGHSYRPELVESAVAAAMANISQHGDALRALAKAGTPDQVTQAMIGFKDVLNTYQAEVVKMQLMRKEEEKLLALKASYSEMVEHAQVPDDVQAQVTGVIGEINQGLEGVVFTLDDHKAIAADLQAKATDFTGRLTDIFSLYKASKLGELRGREAPEDKIAALEAMNDPKEFLDELGTLIAELDVADAEAAAPPAAPTTTSTNQPPENPTGGEGTGDGAGDNTPSFLDPGEMAQHFAADLQETGSIAQTLMNLSSIPIIGGLFRFLATYLRSSSPESFGNIKDTDKDEYFIDLMADGEFKHKRYEGAALATWETMRGHKLRATYWLEEQLRIDGDKVGPKRNVARALFNSEFTIGEFKQIAAKGQNPEIIEEEDLPTDLMEELDIIRGVYNEVIGPLGTDTTKDNMNLAEYVATTPGLYSNPDASSAG